MFIPRNTIVQRHAKSIPRASFDEEPEKDLADENDARVTARSRVCIELSFAPAGRAIQVMEQPQATSGRKVGRS
jgi:hypothetical protein